MARPAGHRGLPHTADRRIEAWAPTREECVAQAVRAVAEGVAELPPPEAVVELRVAPQSDTDLLVTVLDEVVYLMDTTGQVPADTHIRAVDNHFLVRMGMAAPAAVVGAVPKAVSLHDLRFRREGDEWVCAVTLDV